MFNYVMCAAGCGNAALTGLELCGFHCADPAGEAERLAELIHDTPLVQDLRASRMKFHSKDFSKRRLTGCSFLKASFTSCDFNSSFMRMNFFDSSIFIDCDFSGSNIQFSSFGACRFNNCKFNDSELMHLNFDGAFISDTIFDHSNLYNSRFNKAELIRISIVDCNVTRVYFIDAGQTGVNFKSSNTKDAFFELKK